MWIYKHPGFALLLLHELQKQQHSSLHCDALLQTEGVTVPAHSCVLSALSPVFSRALANSPTLPTGQSRLIRLHAIRANVLLKLVGFIYSGEMVGEDLGEQEEVIDVAHRLGFSNLLDWRKKVNGHPEKAVKWKEIGLQTEVTEGGIKVPSLLVLTKEQSFTNAGTRMDNHEANLADACYVSEPEPSIAPASALPSMFSEYSTISPLAGVLLNDPAAASPFSLSETLAPTHFKWCQQIERKRGKNPKKIDQLRKERLKRNQIKLLNVKGTEYEVLNSGILAKTKGIGGKDFRKLIEKLSFQNDDSALEQTGDAQISLKIKLKRRTRGATWQIVSIHEESRAEESGVCGLESGVCGLESAVCGLGASSGPYRAVPGEMHRACEIQVGLSQALPCRSLGTVTLTPPSDLNTSSPATPVRPSSENPPFPTHDPICLSSPLQSTSQGLPQAEESDEHIARLLEEMVMMGINILPSESADGSSMLHLNQPCPHLDPEVGHCEAAPTNCVGVHEHNTAARGNNADEKTTGSSGQLPSGSQNPALESQSRCRTVDLEKTLVPSVASYPTSFVVAPQKHTPSSTFLCSVSEKDPMSTLPVCAGDLRLPHQNVGELKNVFDNLFWAADSHVQSTTQVLSNTTEGHHGNVYTSKMSPSSAAQSNSLDSPCIKKQASLKQTSATVEVLNSDDWASFSEMRLPVCLSPLASEKEESGTLRPLKMSSKLAASPVYFQPPALSSPQPHAFPGKTHHVNPSCSHLYVKQNNFASLSSNDSVLRNSSCSFRPSKGYLEEATKSRFGQVTAQSWNIVNRTLADPVDGETDQTTDKASGIKSVSPKRCFAEAVADEQNGEKSKTIASNLNGYDVQMINIVKPCCVNEGNVLSIDATQQTGNACSKKMDWLRSGKTVKRASTDQRYLESQTHCKTPRPLKCGNQSESIEGMEKEVTLVEKRGCGRPPKKAKCDAGIVQKLWEERKLNNSGFDDSSSAEHYNLQFTQRSKTTQYIQNEEHVLVENNKHVKRTCKRPHEKRKHGLCLLQSVSTMQTEDGTNEGFADRHDVPKAKGKMNTGCEDRTLQEPEISNASTECLNKNTDMNNETTKQPRRHASQSKRPNIIEHIFHQTSYSKRTADTNWFLPVGRQARPRFHSEERKRCTNPPPPLTHMKFIKQSPLKGRKLVIGIDEQEAGVTAEENITERMVEEDDLAKGGLEVDGEAEKVVDKRKNQKVNSENGTVSSEESASLYKSNNGQFVQKKIIDGNYETDADRIQADKIMDVNSNSIHPYLSSENINKRIELGSDLYSGLILNINSTCEVENNSQSESSKIAEQPFRSKDTQITMTSIEKSKILHVEKDLKGEQNSESCECEMTSRCGESTQLVSDMTGDFCHSVITQIVKENVEDDAEKEAACAQEMTRTNEHVAVLSDAEVDVVDVTDQVTTGHGGEEAANADWIDGTGVEGSCSEPTLTDGGATAETLTGQQCLRTEAEGASSDEALMRASVSNEDLSVYLVKKSEQTDQNKPLVNAMGSSARVESPESWDCDEDEEVVVDDAWASPGVLPHLSITRPIAVQDADTEEDLEEEEEVDVTGEETD